MARGWESKSVEDQMAEADARRSRGPAPEPSPEQQRAGSRKADLMLSRTRVLHELQAACNPHHRALLERTLEHLDNQLNELA